MNREFITVCDVKNPLFGPLGTAQIYRAQKGASVSEINLLDLGLKNMATVIKRDLGIDISRLEGAGAAGGVGGGSFAFLNASIQSGIQTILDISKFKVIAHDADLLITGEGKLDEQSLDGKVISSVRDFSIKNKIKYGGICGMIDVSSISRERIGATFLKDI